MEFQGRELDEMELRRGPWTVDEDLLLINYIALNGEGRWNSLARNSGLRRTGKSCRLRWLNYLRPDIRRGNITPEEQLLILELHSRFGNRWSKIAAHIPGRTDNEIKNYWRTRVQKQARQLNCDVNSKKFRDAMKYLWMPRLLERIRAAAAAKPPTTDGDAVQPTSDVVWPPAINSALNIATTGYSSSPELQECSADHSGGQVESNMTTYDRSHEFMEEQEVQLFQSSWEDELLSSNSTNIGFEQINYSLEDLWNDVVQEQDAWFMQ